MVRQQKLKLSLLLLRLTIFLVMFMWTLDKFLHPENAIMIFEFFYHIKGLAPAAVWTIGVIEMSILIMFLMGYKQLISYGLVMIFHSVSTLAAFAQYMSPFEENNLLFFAAWPMLAACVALFLLRNEDQMLSMNKDNLLEPILKSNSLRH